MCCPASVWKPKLWSVFPWTKCWTFQLYVENFHINFRLYTTGVVWNIGEPQTGHTMSFTWAPQIADTVQSGCKTFIQSVMESTWTISFHGSRHTSMDIHRSLWIFSPKLPKYESRLITSEMSFRWLVWYTVSSHAYTQSVSSEIRMKVGVGVIMKHVLHWVTTDLEMAVDPNGFVRHPELSVYAWGYSNSVAFAIFSLHPGVMEGDTEHHAADRAVWLVTFTRVLIMMQTCLLPLLAQKDIKCPWDGITYAMLSDLISSVSCQNSSNSTILDWLIGRLYSTQSIKYSYILSSINYTAMVSLAVRRNFWEFNVWSFASLHGEIRLEQFYCLKHHKADMINGVLLTGLTITWASHIADGMINSTQSISSTIGMVSNLKWHL